MSTMLNFGRCGSLAYVVREERPAEVSSERTPALLCFLHGFGEAAPHELETAMTLHGPLRRGNPKDIVDRMVVVAPQLPEAGDTWQRYADDVREIAQSVAARNACDPTRLYLTGFSYGGNGVFDLALAQPDLWAAFWAVDPTRVPTGKIPAPLFVSLGDTARGHADLYIERLGLKRAAVDSAAFDGQSTHLWKDEGLDHVGTATSAYRDAAIYRWLLSQRRAS